MPTLTSSRFTPSRHLASRPSRIRRRYRRRHQARAFHPSRCLAQSALPQLLASLAPAHAFLGLERREQSVVGVHRLELTALAIGDVAMLVVDSLSNPDAQNKTFAAIRDAAVPPNAWRELLKFIQPDTETDEKPPTAD